MLDMLRQEQLYSKHEIWKILEKIFFYFLSLKGLKKSNFFPPDLQSRNLEKSYPWSIKYWRLFC